MLRKLLTVLALILLGLAAFLYWRQRPLLAVAIGPGAYGKAQVQAQLDAFAKAGNVDVRAVANEGLTGLAKTVAAHAYPADVIDLPATDAIAACQHGLLEKIDSTSLTTGTDGEPAGDDFAHGAIGPCWVGSAVVSQAVIFAPGRFQGPQPKTLADFFDAAKFPGPRALSRDPRFNLEMALLADDLPPEDVYLALSTRQGLDHALQKLASLGPILWWNDPSEAVVLVKGGRAAMATASNGAIYDARVPNVIWDRQLYDLRVFAVPAGDPRKDMGLDFVRFATGSAPLAAMAALAPVGPARHSSLALIGGAPTAAYLPTAHLKTAFAISDVWWQTHGDLVRRRWEAWRRGH